MHRRETLMSPSQRCSGGRKLMVVPAGGTARAPQRARIDNALVKAIERAFRWRSMLESGECAPVRRAFARIPARYNCLETTTRTRVFPFIINMLGDIFQSATIRC